MQQPTVFDNRELAILAWATALLVLCVIARSIRPALVAVIDSLFVPKLLTTFILMALYASVLVWLFSLARIWTPAVAAETLFWFFGPAIVLYSQFDKAGRDPHFFRRTVLATLTVTVVIDFVINLYPFNLVVELLLVPLFGLMGGMLALATEPEHRQVKGLINFLLAVLGFVLVGYTILHIVDAPEEFATLDNLCRFLVPILLSLAFLPFVYGVAVFALYDSLFSRTPGRSWSASSPSSSRAGLSTRRRCWPTPPPTSWPTPRSPGRAGVRWGATIRRNGSTARSAGAPRWSASSPTAPR
jgi:hypothetical protein